MPRVRQALDKLRPAVRMHGGDVELLGVANGVVRLRVQGTRDRCASAGHALKQAIEEAVYQQAPDVNAIDIEEAATGQPARDGRARIALPLLRG